MGEQDIRVVGNALNFRHRSSTGYERLCTDNGGGDTGLFEGNSVVHTAR